MILDMCLVPEDNKKDVKREWAKTTYEATAEGRMSALADLQKLATQRIIEQHSIGDRRAEMNKAHARGKDNA